MLLQPLATLPARRPAATMLAGVRADRAEGPRAVARHGPSARLRQGGAPPRGATGARSACTSCGAARARGRTTLTLSARRLDSLSRWQSPMWGGRMTERNRKSTVILERGAWSAVLTCPFEEMRRPAVAERGSHLPLPCRSTRWATGVASRRTCTPKERTCPVLSPCTSALSGKARARWSRMES